MNRKQILKDASALGLLFLAVLIVIGIDASSGEISDDGGQKSLFGIYRNRSGPAREKTLLQFGGGPETELAVQAGLNWLARHQATDGSWSPACIGNHPGRCNQVARPGQPVPEQDAAPCTGGGHQYSMAQTGLALLAFQAGGHYWFKSPHDAGTADYQHHVKSGLDWVVRNQQEGGGLHDAGTGGQGSHYMYEHGIAAFALAEACATARAMGEEPNPEYVNSLKKAIRFIENEQHEDGGWRYTSNKYAQSDTSVSGWAVLAIKTAVNADIRVSPECIKSVSDYFVRCRREDSAQTNYTEGGQLNSEATTGVGMLVEQFLNKRSDSPFLKTAATHLDTVSQDRWGSGKGTADYYLWYNCSLAMFQVGAAAEAPAADGSVSWQKEVWDRWNESVLLGELLRRQKTEGCAAGSWAPDGSHRGAVGGRVYTTALAVLTLEVYYRFALE